jgi:sulfite exporter TauE/SafE
MKGFLLGLANGTFCLAHCAPILVPYLLSEAKDSKRNCIVLSYFLSGRLIGYVAFAVLAWITNVMVIQNLANRTVILGVVYIALAILLMVYGFVDKEQRCAAKSVETLKKMSARYQALLPAALGLLTGLNLCPPFLLAFATAAANDSLWRCTLFFLTFFVGTSVYFMPLPAIGIFRRYDILRPIGRLAVGIMGVYYIYFGFVTIQRSIHS